MLKEKTVNDCLFGEVTKSGDFYTLDLSLLTGIANQMKPRFFVEQLHRLLRSVEGRLDATDPTSTPPLVELLDQIPDENIHLIRISRRCDVNENVKATLDCSIFLAEGLLRVTAHWCAYKPNRAEEIVNSLLMPLAENNLLDRTFLDWGNDEYEKMPTERSSAIRELVTLAGYPSVTICE